MGLFEKFAAGFSDMASSSYNKMSRNRNLTPEQRERAREVSNHWRNMGDRIRERCDYDD